MVKHKDAKEILEREFACLSFSVIFFNSKPNSNGPDMWVKSTKGSPKSVEVKSVKRLKNGTYQVDPVSKERQSDDLIAILFNTEYVLIEPMKDHLKCCSKKGTRQFTVMRPS